MHFGDCILVQNFHLILVYLALYNSLLKQDQKSSRSAILNQAFEILEFNVLLLSKLLYCITLYCAVLDHTVQYTVISFIRMKDIWTDRDKSSGPSAPELKKDC